MPELKLKCGFCNEIDLATFLEENLYMCNHCHEVNEIIKQGVEKEDKVVSNNDMTIHEWVNFDYKDYVGFILAYINTRDFKDLKADNKEELEAGYLNDKQITQLKKLLKQSVENNWTIKQLMDGIKDKVQPGDLVVQIEDVTDDDGNILRTGYERTIGEDQRVEMLARTEITRSVNNGALAQYKDAGIERVKSSATLSDRTCDFCMSLDGEEMVYSELVDWSGWHPNCRCTFVPIILE